MNYTKRAIGEELKREIKKGYDIERISNWGRDILICVEDEQDNELNNILNHIMRMRDDTKFEYTIEELNLLAEMLFEEVENPIKKIDELKCGQHMKIKIGTDLRRELDGDYNIEKISNWADNALISFRDLPPEVDDILNYISLMGAGPEFEYTREELNLLASMLIREEENPIKRIVDLRQ